MIANPEQQFHLFDYIPLKGTLKIFLNYKQPDVKANGAGY